MIIIDNVKTASAVIVFVTFLFSAAVETLTSFESSYTLF